MKVKILCIITIVIVLIMGSVSVLLFAMVEDNGLKVETPQYINIYKKSISNIEYTAEDENFNKVFKLYKDMAKLSYFNILINDQQLNQKLGQDEKGEHGAWSEFNKVNFYCVEMSFENKQSIILKINSNTKRVDFYNIIFVVEDLNSPSNIYIYYSTSEDKTYVSGTKSYPFIVRAKTHKLYDFINNL